MNQQGVPYETSPARYQLVHELKRKGYETYVFNQGKILHDENWKDIDHFINTANMSKRQIRKKIIGIMPQYIIATTDDDIKILFPLLPVMEMFLIYYNLEIYTPEREQRRNGNKSSLWYPLLWRTAYLWNKTQEVIFIKKCRFFTIQDSLRRRISKKYFIYHPDTLLIPNSYVYNERDRVKNESCGVVYSGALVRFRMEPLMRKLHGLPDFPIVFSGKCDAWFRNQFKILHAAHPAMKLKEQSLPPKKHLEFIKQYAVGLVWYDHSKDENEENIGMASGKLFRHISVGQPVIVSATPGLAKIVCKYKLGIVINDISELTDAYREIMADYSQYQDNIRHVYKSKFDYNQNIKPFLEKMEEM